MERAITISLTCNDYLHNIYVRRDPHQGRARTIKETVSFLKYPLLPYEYLTATRNMNKSTLSLLAFLAVLASVVAEDTYSDMFDHVNIDEILVNDERRNEYYNCIMDTGPCLTDDQKFFKQHATEAFATKCRKCTEQQKQNFEKIVVWYTEKRPDEWNKLVQKMLEDAKKMNITPV